MIEEILKECPLFDCLNEREIKTLAEKSVLKSAVRNQEISEECGLNVIAEGKLSVCSLENDKKVILNTLGKRDAFGYATLYSGQCDKYTVIRAVCDCRYIFIPLESVEGVAEKNGKFALKIIRALTEKVRFLNRKIDTFLSGEITGRVYKYLLSCPKDDEKNVLLPTMTDVAKILGIGRASLYRAIDSLEKSSKITVNGKQIKII